MSSIQIPIEFSGRTQDGQPITLRGTLTATIPDAPPRPPPPPPPPPLTITAVTPNSAALGALLTLAGFGFGPLRGRVTWGNFDLTISRWTDTTILCSIPPSATPSVNPVAVFLPNGAAVAGPLLTVLVPPPPPPPPGYVIVPPGADLQAAINRATPGQTLVLTAGATYPGPLTLPAKSGSGWLRIISSRADELPAAGQRVGPQHAPLMARITAAGDGSAAVATLPGAHHYALVGIEVAPANDTGTYYDLIELGDGSTAQTDPAAIPHDLTLDRCYIHGTPAANVKRGVALNSNATTVTGCCINEIHAREQDSQALAGWQGRGYFTIDNNTLEAAGENVLFGGADPAIPGLVPADIRITRNTITKALAWRGGPWQVKNLIELKNAQRVRIEGNDLSHCWVNAQTGFAVLFTVNGMAPGFAVTDVLFTNNRIRGAAGGIVVAPNSAAGGAVMPPPERITITNNLLVDIDGAAWGGGNGHFLQLGTVRGLTVEHNTVVCTGTTATLEGDPVIGLVFRNNLAGHGGYGISGAGTQPGMASLTRYAPGAVFARNALVAPPFSDPAFPSLYAPETGTLFPETWAAVGFVDAAGGNYRLGAGSPCKGQATDGRDLGCDVDALLAAFPAPPLPLDR